MEESIKVESMQENWPLTLHVPLAKGLIWGFFVFLENKIVWWIVQSSNVIMQVVVEGINLLLIFSFFYRFGQFGLRKMIYYGVPQKKCSSCGYM